jgi:hypothetical protein
MNPRLRVLVGGIAGTLIALFAGVGIANENYLLTVLVGAAVLRAAQCTDRSRDARVEVRPRAGDHAAGEGRRPWCQPARR